MLYDPASTMLYRPEAFKLMGITREQTEQQRELRKEWSRQTAQKYQEYSVRSMAVLSQQQRDKLRPEVEEQYRKRHEPSPEGAAVWVCADVEEDTAADTDEMVLPVYENLGQADVRKTLGMSATQDEQLREIATKCQAELKKLKQETQQLPTAERNRTWPEFQRKSLQIAKDVRPQIETLLTAEQLTALRDIVYRSEGAAWLSEPRTQDELGLSQEQKASLGRLRKEWDEDRERLFQEMSEKWLAVFTPRNKRSSARRWIGEDGRSPWNRVDFVHFAFWGHFN